jgi:hypothetical protein
MPGVMRYSCATLSVLVEAPFQSSQGTKFAAVASCAKLSNIPLVGKERERATTSVITEIGDPDPHSGAPGLWALAPGL